MKVAKNRNAAFTVVEPDKEDAEQITYQAGGIRVRAGIRAGDWQCDSCSGKTMGSNIFKAQCDYCIKQ
jgi:hypothetical protein